MSVVNWKLEYRRKKLIGTYNPFLDSAWEDPVEIKDFKDIKISKSLGEGKDSFSFVLNNINGMYNEYFRPNDMFVISRRFNEGPFLDEHVLMNGAVNNDPLTHAYNRKDIRISGFNHSHVLMNALVYIDATNLPVSTAFQDSLISISFYNKDFQVTWHEDNPEYKYSEDDVKNAGGVFPNCGERFFYRPMHYILNKFSAKDKTNNGNYFWYVTGDNKLRWDKRLTATSGSFDSTSHDYYQMIVKKDINDVKNFVIIKGGFAPDGTLITGYHADYASIANNGFRYHIMIDEAKKAANTLEQDLVKYGVVNMSDASYPLTPDWSGGQSFANFNDYVAGFKEFVRKDLVSIGKKFVDGRRFGRVVVEVYKRPDETVWGLGDVISCNIPQLTSNPNKLLRVEEISYGTEQDLYVLKEDEGTLGVI